MVSLAPEMTPGGVAFVVPDAGCAFGDDLVAANCPASSLVSTASFRKPCTWRLPH
jgi:hypothetical protein